MVKDAIIIFTIYFEICALIVIVDIKLQLIIISCRY